MPNVFGTEMYKRSFADKSVIFSERRSIQKPNNLFQNYFQGGPACQYEINVKKCSCALPQRMIGEKQKHERNNEALCCDRVNKCFKYSKINLNKVGKKYRYTKKQLKWFDSYTEHF